MTENDHKVLRALIAVAWADGQMEDTESTVIDGLLAGFDASDDEEATLREYARTERSLRDVDVSGLSDEDKELLLGNAALLTHADGDQSTAERLVLGELSTLLGFDRSRSFEIIESVRGGALDER
ncbi:MAG: TerB family tellurite resistance protein [Polyangiaceae bacterium]|nr:TerB family tellurite resistance protein [Polyangiaceae bacterium]